MSAGFPCREDITVGMVQIEQDDPVRYDLPIGDDHFEIPFGRRCCGQPILQI
ncbi:hypothetical protein [Rhodococcus sp. USK10]|uniref:hypothetical protein n=1 Tax=Rhodococcus sp. USK10 TaxID=2789739 RepID=UPI002150F9AA|nr:hypothetical protein [Rhodococcus sp. USK10]